jgi:serine protein kinase
MKDPRVTRNAFQRIHDMIMSYGTSTYTEYKKEITRYHFFDDPIENGKDAIFGIDVHLMKLVNFFKSAAAWLWN